MANATNGGCLFGPCGLNATLCPLSNVVTGWCLELDVLADGTDGMLGYAALVWLTTVALCGWNFSQHVRSYYAGRRALELAEGLAPGAITTRSLWQHAEERDPVVVAEEDGAVVQGKNEEALTPRQLLKLRLLYSLVLVAPPVLSTIALGSLVLGYGAIEADALVMVYEGVSLNCFLQLMLAYCGGRERVLGLFSARGLRTVFCLPINFDEAKCKPKCKACCKKVNFKWWSFKDATGLLRFYELSVQQMLPTKFCIAICAVIAHRISESEAESNRYRIAINAGNVISMIIAVRGNVAVFFELRSRLNGLRPMAKYATLRGCLSATLSQRFTLDAIVADQTRRFSLLNGLILIEMLVITLIWLSVFSPNDYVFRERGGAGAEAESSSSRTVGVAGLEVAPARGEPTELKEV